MDVRYHAQEMSDGRVMWWITEVIVVKEGLVATKTEAREAAEKYTKENEIELVDA